MSILEMFNEYDKTGEFSFDEIVGFLVDDTGKTPEEIIAELNNRVVVEAKDKKTDDEGDVEDDNKPEDEDEDEDEDDKDKKTENEDDDKALSSIKDLIELNWSKDNDTQGKAVQMLKGLSFSDSSIANDFMKELDDFASTLKDKFLKKTEDYGWNIKSGKEWDALEEFIKRNGHKYTLESLFKSLDTDTQREYNKLICAEYDIPYIRDAWDCYDALIELIGFETYLDEIGNCLGTNKLGDHLSYIFRMHDFKSRYLENSMKTKEASFTLDNIEDMLNDYINGNISDFKKSVKMLTSFGFAKFLKICIDELNIDNRTIANIITLISREA
jgi:hypothetical protein